MCMTEEEREKRAADRKLLKAKYAELSESNEATENKIDDLKKDIARMRKEGKPADHIKTCELLIDAYNAGIDFNLEVMSIIASEVPYVPPKHA